MAAPARHRITGELTIYRCAELREELLAAVAGAIDLDLDLAAVDEVDGAGVQLLLALHKQLTAGGGRLRITAASDSVREALGLLGRAALMGQVA